MAREQISNSTGELVAYYSSYPVVRTVSHQSLLMIGATVALLGSWYFENQLTQLRERVP
jgi:hypothetical protein